MIILDVKEYSSLTILAIAAMILALAVASSGAVGPTEDAGSKIERDGRDSRAGRTMSRLDSGKLHVRFAPGVATEGPLFPRRYTLTHSDLTGALFLTVAPEVDRKQIAGWYTRLMRDEVVAEWREGAEGPALHVSCHVSGGIVFGSARMRYGIFQRELPLVLAAFRRGDGRPV